MVKCPVGICPTIITSVSVWLNFPFVKVEKDIRDRGRKRFKFQDFARGGGDYKKNLYDIEWFYNVCIRLLSNIIDNRASRVLSPKKFWSDSKFLRVLQEATQAGSLWHRNNEGLNWNYKSSQQGSGVLYSWGVLVKTKYRCSDESPSKNMWLFKTMKINI